MLCAILSLFLPSISNPSMQEDSGWKDNNVFQSGAESSSPARPPQRKPARKSVGPRKTCKSVSAPPEILPSSSPLRVKDEPMFSPPQSNFAPELPRSVTRESRLLAPKFSFVPKEGLDETLDIVDADFADDGRTEDYGEGGVDAEEEEEEEEDHNNTPRFKSLSWSSLANRHLCTIIRTSFSFILIMVRIAISTAFIATVIGLASALSLEQRDLLKASVKKISTVSNSLNIVAHDQARLNHYFKKSPVEELAMGTAPATNEIFSYIAETTVGSQTFNLIVDTVRFFSTLLDVGFLIRLLRVLPTLGLVLPPSSPLGPLERAPVTLWRSRTALVNSRQSAYLFPSSACG
jgi:hypothetical protein